jgi:hypothetical protein
MQFTKIKIYLMHQYVWTTGQKNVIFGYMQQYMDAPAATPMHSYVNFIASIGSLKTYVMLMHNVQKIAFEWKTGSKYHPYTGYCYYAIDICSSL